MGENNVINMAEKKSVFTIKNILRVLSLLCIVFVFCPSFLVSCSGQDMNVNVMTAVGGVEVYGEKVVDPHPIMLLCLLIPIGILVLLFIKKFTDHKSSLIIMVCAVVDFVIWLIFRSSVKKIADENYCSFKTTGWYVVNIIVLILIILLSALVVMAKWQMDAELTEVLSGGGTKVTLDKMSETMGQMSSTVKQLAENASTNIGNKMKKEDVIGFCSKCGNPILYGCKFCASCGTAVPESMLAEAEAKRKEAEQSNKEKSMFCRQCGAKLKEGAMFCESCGTKVN